MYHTKDEYNQVQDILSSIKLTDTKCTINSYFYSNLKNNYWRSDKKSFEEQFGIELEDAILEWGKNEANLPWNYNWLDIMHVWKLNFETIGDFAEKLALDNS